MLAASAGSACVHACQSCELVEGIDLSGLNAL